MNLPFMRKPINHCAISLALAFSSLSFTLQNILGWIKEKTCFQCRKKSKKMMPNAIVMQEKENVFKMSFLHFDSCKILVRVTLSEFGWCHKILHKIIYMFFFWIGNLNFAAIKKNSATSEIIKSYSFLDLLV